MQYSPPSRKASYIVLLILGILFILSPALANAFPSFENLFFALCQIFFFACLLLSARYLLPRYHYRLEEAEFVVIRVTGKRVKTICRLPWNRLVSLSVTPPAPKKRRQHINACQNLFPKHILRLLFEDEEGELLLTVECDDRFNKAIINKQTIIKAEVENHD